MNLSEIFLQVYVTTNQKADMCNSFQVVEQIDTHGDTVKHTPRPNTSYVHVFTTTV